LATTPTTRTIFWRSSWQDGAIDDTYVVQASYTDPDNKAVTLAREIRSRLLDPADSACRDYENDDVNMLQRAMIQLLFLDKGRLTQYRIGKYDRVAQGYYERAAPKKPWSPIADEVWNFDKFSLGNGSPGYTARLSIITGIWEEYARIISAGRLTEAINQSMPAWDYATYRANAVTQSGLDIADPYSETDLLDGLCKQEGTGSGTATHCYALSGPLYWNSVKIGEKNSADQSHTFTDAGLGWGSIQPYNRGTRNLYDPQGNMTRVAQLVKDYYDNASQVPGAKARIWHAIYGYHHGSMSLSSTPAQLRTSQPEAAGYADSVFNRIGSPFTPLPQTNND
jgi:hypothetical protein